MGYPVIMDILFFDRRPMFLFGTAAVFGIYTATGESVIQAVVFFLMFLAAAVVGRTSLRFVITAVVIGLVFLMWGFITENSFDNKYAEYEGMNVTVSGTVISVDSIKEEYTSVTVRPSGFLQKKVKIYLLENIYDVMQGDRIEVSGKLKKPSGATNPGGHDKRKAMYSRGSTAYLYADHENVEIAGHQSLRSTMGLLRRDISGVCIDLLGEGPGAVMAGMLIGDRSGLGEKQSEDFRNSGLSHTMAVSGSHVAYILAPVMFICSGLGMERRKYYPVLLILLLCFAFLTGFTPSVCRAALTASIMLVSGIISRETDALNSLAVSALILMILNPYCIYDAGFILSYSAVISILLFYKPIKTVTGRNPLSKMLALTLSVQPGILPVTIKLFYTVQVFSVISNLLIFPVRALAAVSGWIMYLLSGALMPVAGLVSHLVKILIDCISEVAVLFGDGKLSTVNVPYIPPWIVFITILSVYLAFNIKKHKMIPAGVAGMVLCVYLSVFATPRNTCVFYDVGQADCMLVKTDKGSDILVDTGRYSPGSSLAHFTGDYIDCIFLTHAHTDHIGGLEDILNRFRVGRVFIPGGAGTEMEYVLWLCEKFSVPVSKVNAGAVIDCGGYRLEIVNPVNRDYLSLNDSSMVIKLTYGDASLLLSGDIEITAEKDILSGGWEIETDILKVPHHGAGSSADSEFFKAVNPGIAVISCGRNYFGHPSFEVLELLDGCNVFRTDRDGAVIIKIDKDGYKITTFNR